MLLIQKNIQMKKTSGYILIIAVLISVLAGCSTSSLLTKGLNASVSNDINKIPDLPEYIVLNTDSLKKQDEPVTVKRIKALFIPAIIFWDWSYVYQCDISNRYFENIFKEIISHKTEEAQLESLLKGKQIEITLLKTPATSLYKTAGSMLILLYSYSYTVEERMYTNGQALEVRYRILNDGKELKTDSYTHFFNQSLPNNKMSMSNFAGDYMNSLSDEYVFACNEFIDKLIENL